MTIDVFLWGKCLTEDEAASLHAAIGIADLDMIDLADDNLAVDRFIAQSMFPPVECCLVYSYLWGLICSKLILILFLFYQVDVWVSDTDSMRVTW